MPLLYEFAITPPRPKDAESSARDEFLLALDFAMQDAKVALHPGVKYRILFWNADALEQVGNTGGVGRRKRGQRLQGTGTGGAATTRERHERKVHKRRAELIKKATVKRRRAAFAVVPPTTTAPPAEPEPTGTPHGTPEV